MNIRKISLMLFVLAVTFIFFTIPSDSYATGMYICKVDEIGGPWNGDYYITLTEVNNAFYFRPFKIDKAEVNRIMAVALTAISLEKNVRVYLTSTVKIFNS